MTQKQELELTGIGKENRPKLELDERDAGGLLGDAGDKDE
jgi:hypothetical protein